MKESKFGYAVARTRSLEKTLLDKSRLERLLAASSLEEALEQLQDTVYGDAVGELASPQDYEHALDQVLTRTYETVDEMGHGIELETLRWRYDFVNIKLILRARRKEEDSGQLSPLGSLDPEILAASENWEELPVSWREAVFSAQGQEDPQRLDFILDRTFFKEALLASNNHYLTGLWRLEIDLINIRTFLRLASMGEVGKDLWAQSLIPGGQLDPVWEEVAPPDVESLGSRLAMGQFGELFNQGVRSWRTAGSLSVWERLADNFRLEYIIRAKYIPFGPEPLLAYILGRENEIKLLRIILAGKANHLSSEEIRERLREVYG